MPVPELNQINKYDVFVVGCIVFLVIFLILSVFFSGCLGISSVADVKTAALDVISPIVVLKGSTQYEKMVAEQNLPTPLSTPIPIPTTYTPLPTPTIAARTIDPYVQGERWEKQWYRHVVQKQPNPLFNATYTKPLDFGVVIYDHKFMNSYTWWSDRDGQYYNETPKPGYKFLFIWVHEEIFGDPKTHVASMEGFNVDSFLAQYKQSLYYNDTSYNPVNRVLEFDTKPDYYRISRTSAFGYTRIYYGKSVVYDSPGYGGWIAERDVDLYIGQGNSWDGYIVYQVPASATDHDTLLIGNFGAYGNAYWRFDIYA